MNSLNHPKITPKPKYIATYLPTICTDSIVDARRSPMHQFFCLQTPPIDGIQVALLPRHPCQCASSTAAAVIRTCCLQDAAQLLQRAGTVAGRLGGKRNFSTAQEESRGEANGVCC